MDSGDQSWLENRLHAAVDDDFYLDRDEEKRIKEEGASRGIAIREIELTIQSELKKTGSVSERQLLEELERLLHQFTDDDKYLDAKEERNAFDHVVLPAGGKRKGLDPRLAEEYVASFCKVNGIRRSSDRRFSPMLLGAGILTVLILALLASIALRNGKTGEIVAGHTARALVATDRTEVDRHLRQAEQYIEQAQYTDPPERSAKAELDEISQIDPDATYREEEVNGLKRRIVEHYLALAEQSVDAHNLDGARRWIERARLLKVDKEGIDDRARTLGIANN